MIEKELTHIDLFSGIGGFTLAAEWAGFKTVVFCEKERFCQEILEKRFGAVIADPKCGRFKEDCRQSHNNGTSQQRKKTQGKKSKIRGITNTISTSTKNGIPIIPEIRDFDGTKYRGATLLTGGFPCQPFSVAGQRRGKKDDRYLWPEMFRVIKEARPRWILAENVTGIIKLAIGQVLSDLEGIGYDFPRDHEGTPIVPVIPACGLNAPHRRNRVWIIAYYENVGLQGMRTPREQESDTYGKKGIFIGENRDASDSKCERPISGKSQKWTRRKKGIFERLNSHASDPSSRGIQGKSISIRPRQSRQATCNIKRGSQDVTDSDSGGTRRHKPEGIKKGPTSRSSHGQVTPDSKSRNSRQQETRDRWEGFERGSWQENWYEVATRFCRVDDGVSDRIHRLKALGNAIVPQIAYEILKNIVWIERELRK